MTTTVTKDETITIEHDGKKVYYNTKTQEWEYDGVDEDVVQKVNPALYAQITEDLKKSVAEYQKRVDAENKRVEKERIDKSKQELTEFQAKVTPLIPNGFESSYRKIDGYGDPRWLNIAKARVDADVYYNDRVYRGGWSNSKTDLVWVMEFAYKKQRFSTLDKAIAGAIKRINERVAGNELQKTYDDEKNRERQKNADELKSLGISFGIDSKWVCRSRGRGYSQELPTAKINIGKDKLIKGLVDKHKDKPISIYQVSIDGAFTAEQFKKLADFVKSLHPKNENE